MKIRIGSDTYSVEYYERRKSWFIRINENETLYTKDNIWREFDTMEEAEEYLKEMAKSHMEAI